MKKYYKDCFIYISIFFVLHLYLQNFLFIDWKLPIFPGILSLIGFAFAARTFIVFKLNEEVYSKSLYQERVEKYQDSGLYDGRLYDPLKRLDCILYRTTVIAFFSLVLIVIISLISKPSILEKYTAIDLIKNINSKDFVPAKFSKTDALKAYGYKIFSDITITAIAATFIYIWVSISAINRNIKMIIYIWENPLKQDE